MSALQPQCRVDISSGQRAQVSCDHQRVPRGREHAGPDEEGEKADCQYIGQPASAASPRSFPREVEEAVAKLRDRVRPIGCRAPSMSTTTKWPVSTLLVVYVSATDGAFVYACCYMWWSTSRALGSLPH
jgi:hypothetical protein